MGDQKKSQDYFFRRLGGEVENRVNEPQHVTEARDILNPADIFQTWRMQPPDVQPLSSLGRLLGGAEVAQPSQAELSRFIAGISALNNLNTLPAPAGQPTAMTSFNDRWIPPR